ncbi:hypothetical protein HanRHA438_Chr11g0483001 [Helianthus annuus]|nr:hypothetical protein HanHA300_Chr11g0385481 [Helianthus annuus]KAJ0515884.1 hypothetical protein HanHA89_Chr11g0407761 [Helianthus annuus]KAJ0687862.1 hypothetical protein HanOQP8_Chr11g0388091 [Helianthus annuus]KAJ0868872.1 hypothetical protein HanRHA438_Chr11g0483001 [Helianthus annuus]
MRFSKCFLYIRLSRRNARAGINLVCLKNKTYSPAICVIRTGACSFRLRTIHFAVSYILLTNCPLLDK